MGGTNLKLDFTEGFSVALEHTGLRWEKLVFEVLLIIAFSNMLAVKFALQRPMIYNYTWFSALVFILYNCL